MHVTFYLLMSRQFRGVMTSANHGRISTVTGPTIRTALVIRPKSSGLAMRTSTC